MGITERATIKQNIFKKQNCSYFDDSCHWLCVVCPCISDTISVQCHSGINASYRTSVLWGMAVILMVLSVAFYFKACSKKII